MNGSLTTSLRESKFMESANDLFENFSAEANCHHYEWQSGEWISMVMVAVLILLGILSTEHIVTS